jgi:hypothetical protein
MTTVAPADEIPEHNGSTGKKGAHRPLFDTTYEVHIEARMLFQISHKWCCDLGSEIYLNHNEK